jgi:hypothetical protein
MDEMMSEFGRGDTSSNESKELEGFSVVEPILQKKPTKKNMSLLTLLSFISRKFNAVNSLPPKTSVNLPG